MLNLHQFVNKYTTLPSLDDSQTQFPTSYRTMLLLYSQLSVILLCALQLSFACHSSMLHTFLMSFAVLRFSIITPICIRQHFGRDVNYCCVSLLLVLRHTSVSFRPFVLLV